MIKLWFLLSIIIGIASGVSNSEELFRHDLVLKECENYLHKLCFLLIFCCFNTHIYIVTSVRRCWTGYWRISGKIYIGSFNSFISIIVHISNYLKRRIVLVAISGKNVSWIYFCRYEINTNFVGTNFDILIENVKSTKINRAKVIRVKEPLIM